MKIPYVKKPCKDCPFRKDSLKGWLGRARAEELAATPSFVCHKNTALQCAGHMILKGESNIFVATTSHYSIDLNLKGTELVFEDVVGFINHHE